MQVSSSGPATASSSAATGLSAVTPVSRPPSAAGSDGSSNCTTTGVSSRRASSARCAPTPSPSDAARSRSAPASVIARWPLASSSPAARVIGPGACTLTTRPPPRRPAVSQASSRASMSSSRKLIGPPRHRAWPSGDAVPARHRVDGHVDQQRAGPAEHVGAHSPGGQFDDVGHRVRQFADDHLGGLPRRGTGPGSDAGGLRKDVGENTHPATVFDVTSRTRWQGWVPVARRYYSEESRKGAFRCGRSRD